MQTKMKAILMALAILLPLNKILAQSVKEKIEDLVNKAHENRMFDGAILVANKEGVLFKKGFGKANIENGFPNGYNTVFYIASLSKPFTALLVMQLVQSGKIGLSTTLENYFPDLKNKEIRAVTIHQLLSHTSGIPDFIDGSVASEKLYTDRWFTEKIDQLKLDSTAGKKFKYANSTYVLLAHIIKKVTRRSYAENLEKNIFLKAGMQQSASLITGQPVKNIAKGYMQKDSVTINAPLINAALFQGAGSIYSTVEDLYKFDRALYTNVLISDQYKDLMFASQGGSYGYGWFTGKLPIGKIVFHEGDLPGYTSMIFRAIEKRYFVVLLSNNQSNDKYKQDIIKQIARLLNEDEKN